MHSQSCIVLHLSFVFLTVWCSTCGQERVSERERAFQGPAVKPAFYGPVIVFLSTITAITHFLSRPFPGPPGALNRVYFTNGRLSSDHDSPVYKYVKYTFNYFKWIWQIINNVGRDKHTLDVGHCKAAGKKISTSCQRTLAPINILRLSCLKTNGLIVAC